MKSSSIAEYVKLSVPELIQLVEDIWDSIAEMPEELPLTEAQRVELGRRLNAYRLNPGGLPALLRADAFLGVSPTNGTGRQTVWAANQEIEN